MNDNRINSSSIRKATLIIGLFSLLAKISGLVRDAIFSHEFGTSILIDAYFAAFRIPDFIFNILILGTVSVAFIPIFSEYLFKDKAEADRIASSIINVTLLAMVGLTFLAFIFIDPLLRLIVPGFVGEAFELTKSFAKILLLSPILLTISSITSSILNAYKRFTIVSAAPLVYNLSIIFGVLVLHKFLGSSGLALGVVLGALLHLVIQLPQLVKLGFKYTAKFNIRHPGIIKFWKLYLPRIFSMGISQISLLVASIFGSFLGEGSLSAFYYANNLQSVFLSIFAISASIAVFPTLADFYNQQNEQGFKDVLAKTTIQILYFILPLSVFMLVERAQIVRLVLGIGENTSFTFDDTRVVSLTLGLFVVSLFAQSLAPLFMRAFYARHNTIIPMIISLITVAANTTATYYFVGKYGIPGLAIAFSLASILQLIMLMAELHYKIGDIHDNYIILNSLKIVISSLIAGLSIYVSLYLIAPWVDMRTYLGVFSQAMGAAIVGGLGYLGATALLGIEETRHLVSLLKSFGYKLAKPVNVLLNIKE